MNYIIDEPNIHMPNRRLIARARRAHARHTYLPTNRVVYEHLDGQIFTALTPPDILAQIRTKLDDRVIAAFWLYNTPEIRAYATANTLIARREGRTIYTRFRV